MRPAGFNRPSSQASAFCIAGRKTMALEAFGGISLGQRRQLPAGKRAPSLLQAVDQKTYVGDDTRFNERADFRTRPFRGFCLLLGRHADRARSVAPRSICRRRHQGCAGRRARRHHRQELHGHGLAERPRAGRSAAVHDLQKGPHRQRHHPHAGRKGPVCPAGLRRLRAARPEGPFLPGPAHAGAPRRQGQHRRGCRAR